MQTQAIDYTTLITSEHKKPKFLALVAALCNTHLGAAANSAYGMIEQFDLDNAEGAQLDILGQWIGQSRIIPNVLSLIFFGFQDDPAALPFGELGNPAIGGRFYELGEPTGSTTVLGDPEYRTLLRAKITRNQWDGSVSGLEAALSFIAPGIVYSISDMANSRTVTITIQNSSISAAIKALLISLSILPRAGGVTYTLVFV